MFKLRPYQKDSLQASREASEQGIRRQLTVLPTGTGKTILFASVPNYYEYKNRILVLAHREELVDQNATKIRQINPSMSVGIEMDGQVSSSGDQIVVASPQSLNSSRINKFDPRDFDAVITDEFHHYTSPSFRKVLNTFGLDNPQSKALFYGVTATPNRSDGAAMGTLVDRIVYQYSMRDAISDGYLADLRGFKVYGHADLSGVKTTAGDLNQGQLADAVNSDYRNGIIVRAWIDNAPRVQTIAFCVDIQHSKDLALKFQQAGVPAEAIWGADPERKEKLARHREGVTQVLTNCSLLAEGYDDWRIGCVILAAPTKSGLLYTQRIGRVTRIQPGIDNINDARTQGIVLLKESGIILDVVDSSSKHSLITLPSLFGMNAEMDLKGKSAFKAIKKLEELEEKHQKVDFSKLIDISQIKAHVEAVNLFDFKTPDIILQNSELRWHQNFDGSFTLRLPAHTADSDTDIMIEGTTKPAYSAVRRGPQMLTIRENLLGQFEIKGEVQDDVIAESGIKSFADAVLQAELLLSSKGRKYVALLRREWKSGGEPVTVNQWGMLQRFYGRMPDKMSGLNDLKDKGELTKQRASHIIDQFMQAKFQKRTQVTT